MIQFLLKGLLRDRSRSLFPMMTVAAGVFLTVFLYGWLNGVIGEWLDNSARFETGHVKVVTRAYHELYRQTPNDLCLLDVGELLDKLRLENPELTWTPRIKFGGLLDVPDKNGETITQGPCMGLAVDLSPGSPELEVLNLEKALVSGTLPGKADEILMSEEFATKLGVRLGEKATLMSSTMNGAMAVHNFTVSGFIRFGIGPMDRSMIIADLRGARQALDMEDGASEIIGLVLGKYYEDEKMVALSVRYNTVNSDPADEFSPLMLALRHQQGMSYYLDRMDSMGGMIISIFVLAMFIVLWNSGLMNALRRYSEIGLRLAMGEHKGTLYRWMVVEALMTGLIGTVFGTVLGLVATFYLQEVGWDMSELLKSSTVMIPNVMRAQVTVESYYIGLVPGLLAPALGALIAGLGIFKRQTAQLFKELEV